MQLGICRGSFVQTRLYRTWEYEFFFFCFLEFCYQENKIWVLLWSRPRVVWMKGKFWITCFWSMHGFSNPFLKQYDGQEVRTKIFKLASLHDAIWIAGSMSYKLLAKVERSFRTFENKIINYIYIIIRWKENSPYCCVWITRLIVFTSLLRFWFLCFI